MSLWDHQEWVCQQIVQIYLGVHLQVQTSQVYLHKVMVLETEQEHKV